MLNIADHDLDIASLIPHQNGMCLLDGVLSWDEDCIRCCSASHRNPSNPLRTAEGLLAVCGIEYAAQAVAVHGGLKAKHAAAGDAARVPSLGYLANAKDVRWHVARLDDIAGDLIVDAQQLISEGGRSIYSFALTADGQAVMEGRVAVVLEGFES